MGTKTYPFSGYYHRRRHAILFTIFLLSYGWLWAMVAGLMLVNVGSVQAITLVGEAFSGNFSLPVYHANPGERQCWL